MGSSLSVLYRSILQQQPIHNMAATAFQQFPRTKIKGCKLLDLSAELRNMIYEWALCEEEAIAIKECSLNEGPGLLRTCKQISEEALAIYHCENKFEIDIFNFNIDLAIACFHRPYALKYYLGDNNLMNSWSNILKWLHVYHDNEMPLFCASDVGHASEDFHVAGCAFDIVRERRHQVAAHRQDAVDP